MRGVFSNRIIALSFLLGILSGCGGGSDGSNEVAVVENFGIAYVKRPLPEVDNLDIRNAFAFRAGGDLYLRDLAAPGVPERNITGGYTGGTGDVKDVSVPYDGQRLLFAMRARDRKRRILKTSRPGISGNSDLPSDGLRRAIDSDIVAEAGQDIAPAYLPDGRIVFSSTRQRQSKAILLDEGKPPQFDALDENLNQAQPCCTS